MIRAIQVLIVVLLAGAIAAGGYYFYRELVLVPKQAEAEIAAAPTPTPPPPPDPGLEPLAEAKALEKADDFEGARVALEQLLEKFPESRAVGEAKELLGEINADLFFSNRTESGKTEYTVGRGDSLNRISTRTKVPIELIMRTNNLEGTLLQVGQVLLIPDADFSLLIDTGEKTVTLYNKGRFFREYKATRADVRSPAGGELSTKVAEKMAWKDGTRITFESKDYLGSSRWIRFSTPGYDLYTDWEAAGVTDNADVRRPAGGIGLLPEHLEEIHALLGGRAEVLIR